jgi:hypothetical protein
MGRMAEQGGPRPTRPPRAADRRRCASDRARARIASLTRAAPSASRCCSSCRCVVTVRAMGSSPSPSPGADTWPRSCSAWGSRRCTASPTRARGTPSTRSIRTCCASSRSIGPTRSGRATSRTSRWPVAGSTCVPSSTGRAGECWRTGCRSPWTPRSAWRRSRTRWPGTGSPRSSTPTRAASSPARRSPRR